MMPADFYLQPIFKKLINNRIKLYGCCIIFPRSMKEDQTDLYLGNLPSTSLALLGLIFLCLIETLLNMKLLLSCFISL